MKTLEQANLTLLGVLIDNVINNNSDLILAIDSKLFNAIQDLDSFMHNKPMKGEQDD